MGFYIELVRKDPSRRTGGGRRGKHKGREDAGQAIDSFAEEGEIIRVVEREGADRLPTLARLDPYGYHFFDAYWCELMLTDISRINSSALSPSEAAVIEKLTRWAQVCVRATDSDHIIRFIGD
ncbi:hypothetical protein [Streptomyces sp. HYC2]|uniref:hypothetical protein n=1 Tax=Streptomyces sp. HYC2 TaxID=2955207 RepID=UPI0024809590|nr:hypothetical protein [Streptomyces sp. HYC2]